MSIVNYELSVISGFAKKHYANLWSNLVKHEDVSRWLPTYSYFEIYVFEDLAYFEWSIYNSY